MVSCTTLQRGIMRASEVRENVCENNVLENGGTRGCEGVTPAHPRGSPESAGERRVILGVSGFGSVWIFA